jgi:exoribonuclease-2
MNVLYEEEGEFKVGTVLATHPASLQIETAHGRRAKVKASRVLLQFEHPPGAQLLRDAERYAAELDTELLWECSGPAEFSFQDLAREYVGRPPSATEAAGVLLKLHSAPLYFHRRGKGCFQAAPAETVRLALANLEKKKRLAERIEAWAGALARFECPSEIASLQRELLYQPDRARPEAKALEQACERTGLTAAALFERCGLLPDSHAYHLGRFLHEFPVHGGRFPGHIAPQPAGDLPLAGVNAFSIDDAETSEIDDAFSVVRLSEELLRVGIHIAAPALGIEPGSPLDAVARERLSSAYFPDRKFTMLPPDVVGAFSLDAGAERPCVSLYVDVSTADRSVRASHSRVERLAVAANLRLGDLEALNAALPAGEKAGVAFEEELRMLWRFAEALERARGKPSAAEGVPDYVFRVANGRVRIELRRRGVPLDKLVSELMILANRSWGEFLAERGVAAIYRVQSAGKVRLSVHPEAHDGLGLSCYAWMTSPLRRYVDLVNQRQLVATLRGERAPLRQNSEALLAAIQAFELAYARYDEHQRALENYWALRWLLQEGAKEVAGTVVRENLVRLDGLPLSVRVPSLPALDPGRAVRLQIERIDLIDGALRTAFRGAEIPARPEVSA